MTGPRRLLWLWAAVSLAWLGGVAYVCLSVWPSIPLDLSPSDPATRSALARAVATHAIRCTVLGLTPPLVLLALGWFGARMLRTRS